MEKSKLPVLRSQTLNTADLPVHCLKRPCPQKPGLPLYSKDPNIAFASTIPDFGMFKGGSSSGKKPVASKKAMPPARGPITRYRMESELKDKNQLLEAANASLHSNLLSTQNTVRDMSERQDALQEELKEAKQRLEKSLIILENYNIDPVAGEQILNREEERSAIREETKALTEDLIRELKLVTVSTKEHTQLFQDFKENCKKSEESRKKFLEEQKEFQNDLDQFRTALEDTEKWLDS